jgi:hypothetical protein
MGTVIGLNIELAVILLLAGYLIIILFIIILWFQFRGSRKKYAKIMKGAEGKDIEDLMLSIQERLSHIEGQGNMDHQEIQAIKEKMIHLKAKVGILRYNAFSDQGSDLSFSLAIVDEKLNGVVISGLHSREESLVYAKPLKEGQSRYALSPEEKQAISLAQTSDKP